MEIISKGGLYGGGSVNQLGSGRPETRNAVLTNILELLRVTENRYSGIPTMMRAFEEAHLPQPVFRDMRGTFKVVFYNGMTAPVTAIDKTDMFQAILAFCAKPRSREELTAFTGKSRYFTMTAVVQPLLREGKLRMTLPDKPKSSKQMYVTISENKTD